MIKSKSNPHSENFFFNLVFVSDLVGKVRGLLRNVWRGDVNGKNADSIGHPTGYHGFAWVGSGRFVPMGSDDFLEWDPIVSNKMWSDPTGSYEFQSDPRPVWMNMGSDITAFTSLDVI